MNHQVIVVGGGIAGLTAALTLHKKGIDYLLLEATPEVGGRVKTRQVDGFLFDRGFQVLLTAYPEAQSLLDYKALALSEFKPGAMLLLDGGRRSIFGDPLRDLSSFWSTLTTSAGTLNDKLLIYRLSSKLKKTTIDSIFVSKEVTTLRYLQNYGFSQKIIESFFRPFFSGIFLETALNTSSRMFQFVFKMFSEGSAALPQKGMQAIPRQLESRLDSNKIFTAEKVISIGKNSVQTEQNLYTAEHIILATDAIQLADTLSRPRPKYNSTMHAHFISESVPFNEPLIALQSNKHGIVNNLCVVNKVCKSYAQNSNLISLTLRTSVQLEEVQALVQKEMKNWFPDAEKWELIDLQKINYALPDQHSVSEGNPYIREENFWICGDHTMHGSLQSAMKSGRLVGEAVAKEIGSM